jgi:hypothetical protein
MKVYKLQETLYAMVPIYEKTMGMIRYIKEK